MSVTLKGRSLLTLKELSSEEIRYLIELSMLVKRERRQGELRQRFAGRTLALIFEKPSTRTRCAFETAFGEEGGHPVFLARDDIQLGTKESVEDTARVLGRMFDCIQFRGFRQTTVEVLAALAGVPVYNGLTDDYHPTQVLADLMTLEERFGSIEGLSLAFCGDGRNNVARTLLVGCPKMGINVTIVSPRELHPDQAALAEARELARASGAEVRVTEDLEFGVRNADAIYTDVWASMGEEAESERRERLLRPYQVNRAAMASTGKPRTVFMHCLPAVKGNEVTGDVIEGPQSVVWDEAENRKHTIKALMLSTLLGPGA